MVWYRIVWYGTIPYGIVSYHMVSYHRYHTIGTIPMVCSIRIMASHKCGTEDGGTISRGTEDGGTIHEQKKKCSHEQTTATFFQTRFFVVNDLPKMQGTWGDRTTSVWKKVAIEIRKEESAGRRRPSWGIPDLLWGIRYPISDGILRLLLLSRHGGPAAQQQQRVSCFLLLGMVLQ